MTILLMLINGLLLAILFYNAFSNRKQHLKTQEKITALEQAIDQINITHPVLVNADLLFAKQIREINTQLVSMDNQLQNLENIRANDGGYQHALRILEMGGDKDEIVTSCHLSNAEADLLMNLQAYRAAIKAS